MALVPTQEIPVAHFEPHITKIDESKPNIKGWLTKSTIDANVPYVLRMLPQYTQEVNDAYPGVLDTISGSRNVGCINGMALVETSFNVKTIGGTDRPKKLYRAVHGGQPHGGTKSRLGRGSDPIFLQIHLKKHLRWSCRQPSPFLSATNDEAKAFRIASMYMDMGFEGIHIIEFRTDGPGWDHNVQRMWHARTLVLDLGMRKDNKKYLDNEFLIEHSIPNESIISRDDWRENMALRDPDGTIRREARAELEEKEKMCVAEKKRRREKAHKARELVAGLDKDGENEASDSQTVRVMGKRIKIGPRMGPHMGS
ncbi:hypothetical protein SUNI508_06238 [Seiridium unicorne]|uniref:DUF7587 domain-containing protein n=1 Tax=Seiridium unicorne TaxID=138068 RepID=A0ABR2V371_9PEZI